MAPLYKKALIVGATSGIGAALASKLISQGTPVIITGRRKDRLDAFTASHDSSLVSAIQFDVLDFASIPVFAKSVIDANPDLDCVVVNSGVQRGFDFAQPESLNLSGISLEMNTNYVSVVHLTAAFLPHLKTKDLGHLVYVSATLGLVPTLLQTPNYSASNAALHAFILTVRQRLKEAGQNNVRMVEVFPPAVQTELHDEKHQPHLVNGGQIGMPLDAYTEKMFEGLVKGDEQFAVGHGDDLLNEGGWEDQRLKMVESQSGNITKALSKFLKQ